MSVKYPRTPHLPWSQGAISDDSTLSSLTCFYGKEVVVTEKLDGENTSMTNLKVWARSLDSIHHPSRHWIKAYHSSISHHIPPNMQIAGESLYASHSILYTQLPSYFVAFSVFYNGSVLHWDDVCEYCFLIGSYSEFSMPIAPILYRGIWNEDVVKSCYTGQSLLGGEQEGYVVRLVEGFAVTEFSNNVAKFVRTNHVAPNSKHGRNTTLILNKLAL